MQRAECSDQHFAFVAGAAPTNLTFAVPAGGNWADVAFVCSPLVSAPTTLIVNVTLTIDGNPVAFTLPDNAAGSAKFAIGQVALTAAQRASVNAAAGANLTVTFQATVSSGVGSGTLHRMHLALETLALIPVGSAAPAQWQDETAVTPYLDDRHQATGATEVSYPSSAADDFTYPSAGVLIDSATYQNATGKFWYWTSASDFGRLAPHTDGNNAVGGPSVSTPLPHAYGALLIPKDEIWLDTIYARALANFTFHGYNVGDAAAYFSVYINWPYHDVSGASWFEAQLSDLYSGGNAYLLLNRKSGTGYINPVASYNTGAALTNTAYTIELIVDATNVKVYLNGTLRITYAHGGTDLGYGPAGFLMSLATKDSSTYTGFTCEDFTYNQPGWVDSGDVLAEAIWNAYEPIRSQDTFTDTNGTFITAHVPEAGGWLYHASAKRGEIQSNRLVCSTTNQDGPTGTKVLTVANQPVSTFPSVVTVQATLHVFSKDATNPTVGEVRVYYKYTETFFGVKETYLGLQHYHDPSGNKRWELRKVVDNVPTLLASQTATLTDGSDYGIVMEVNDSAGTVSVTIGGTPLFNTTYGGGFLTNEMALHLETATPTTGYAFDDWLVLDPLAVPIPAIVSVQALVAYTAASPTLVLEKSDNGSTWSQPAAVRSPSVMPDSGTAIQSKLVIWLLDNAEIHRFWRVRLTATSNPNSPTYRAEIMEASMNPASATTAGTVAYGYAG